MKCKGCNKEFWGQQVVYQRSMWTAQGEIVRGQPSHETEIYEDGGLFCSDDCLAEYLKQKGGK